MRILLFLFLLVVVLDVSAQTDKGNIMVGGQLGLSTNKDGSDFRFNPQFGVFVAKNFAVGGEMSFDFAKSGNIRNNEFGIGPFARYYFGKGQTKPFLVTSADYVLLETKINNLETTSSGWNILIGAGFAAFLNRQIAIEGIAGYRYANYSNTEGSGGFNLSLGFQLYFGKELGSDIKKTVTGQ